MTLRFLIAVVVVKEVFKVFALDRNQQHGLWSRTLTFQFPEVACTIFPILAVQAHPQYRVMSVGKGFFGLFPWSKKVRCEPPVRVRGCPLGRALDSGGLCGGAGQGRVRRVLRVPRRLMEAGLGLRAPVLLLVQSPP